MTYIQCKACGRYIPQFGPESRYIRVYITKYDHMSEFVSDAYYCLTCWEFWIKQNEIEK